MSDSKTVVNSYQELIEELENREDEETTRLPSPNEEGKGEDEEEDEEPQAGDILWGGEEDGS